MAPVFLPANIKIIARWALVLFVMAWVNLIIQAPVHAAMKQLSHQPCHCDVTLCDTVMSMEEQSDDALGFTALDVSGFQVAFVTLANIDAITAIADRAFDKHDLDVRQAAPPPLLLKTTLLI